MSSDKDPGKQQRDAEYTRLLESYRAEFAPGDVHERFLVEQMAHSAWKLIRLGQMKAAAQAEESGETIEAARFLDRYMAAAQKSYDRAHRELTKLKRAGKRTPKSKKKKPDPPPFDTAFRA
jgi:hypothetical protein